MAYINPGMFMKAGSSIGRGLMSTARHVRRNPGNTLRRGVLGAGGLLAAGMTGMGIASKATMGTFGIANKTLRGIMPNTYYPAASGQFGVRTSTQAGPAGIEGLKFNFRRR